MWELWISETVLIFRLDFHGVLRQSMYVLMEWWCPLLPKVQAQTQYSILHLMIQLPPQRHQRKERLHIKLCKIRLYSFFFCIVAFHHRCHHHYGNHHHCLQHHLKTLLLRDRQPENKFSKRLAAQTSKNRHQLIAQSRSTKRKLYMSNSFWAKHFTKLSNVLIYNSLSFRALSPFSSQDVLFLKTMKGQFSTDMVRMLDITVLLTT